MDREGQSEVKHSGWWGIKLYLPQPLDGFVMTRVAQDLMLSTVMSDITIIGHTNQ